MLPYGKLEPRPGTRAQVLSRWWADLEAAGCRVRKVSGERLSVRVPGWDAQDVFWDQMMLNVAENGEARFRLVYLSPARVFLHLAVAAIFVIGAGAGGGGRDAAPRAFFFAVAELVPWLVTLVAFSLAREAALLRAARQDG